MLINRRAATAGMLSLLTGNSIATLAHAELGELNLGEGLEDFWLATDAYIYGYPLVTMEMTRRVITNVARPEGTKAPMGHIIKLRQYPDASFRDVTAPNADTLYTTAFVDVGKEPWVLSIPDMEIYMFIVVSLRSVTYCSSRTGSIADRQGQPPTALAASDGQILPVGGPVTHRRKRHRTQPRRPPCGGRRFPPRLSAPPTTTFVCCTRARPSRSAAASPARRARPTSRRAAISSSTSSRRKGSGIPGSVACAQRRPSMTTE